MHKSVMLISIMMAAAIVTEGANANPNDPSISLSGFGTIGLVHSSEDQADFVADILRPSGAGHSRTLSYEVDSRLGAQLMINATDRWSAVVQVITEQRYDDSFRPTVEWANISYSVSPDFTLRAGRIALPTFLVGDTRKVGYANPWIRPPVGFYSLVPITNSDGADISYRLHAGAWTHTTQASFGRTRINLPGDESSIDAEDLVSLSHTMEYRALILRAAYAQARLQTEILEPLFQAFRSFGPQGTTIANHFSIDGKRASFMGAGASYEGADWFAMAEWGRIHTRSAIGNRTAWYTSGGKRFGEFTTYVTVGRTWLNSESSTPGLDLAALPPEQAQAALMLNASLNEFLRLAPEQQTISAGVRWDFAANYALKLQYDRINLATGSIGTLTNPQPEFVPGGTANVLGISMDFVF